MPEQLYSPFRGRGIVSFASRAQQRTKVPWRATRAVTIHDTHEIFRLTRCMARARLARCGVARTGPFVAGWNSRPWPVDPG